MKKFYFISFIILDVNNHLAGRFNLIDIVSNNEHIIDSKLTLQFYHQQLAA